MSSLPAKKDEARVQAREAIARVSPDVRVRASEAIQAQLLELPEFDRADAVFSYISFGKEIDTGLILRSCYKGGKRLFVPAMAGGEYVLSELNEGDEFSVGNYGISEPVRPRAIEGKLPALLAVVPGLAFDRSCHRLGRGGGHYDRMLHKIASTGTDLVNVGLAYSCSLYDRVPVEPYDFDVDIVITENELVRRSHSG